MGFADRHNKGTQKFDFRLEGEDITFKKLADLDKDKVYVIGGFFISKEGKYGRHPVAVVKDDSEKYGGFFVDFPKNSLDEIKGILESEDDAADINAGKVGFTTHTYDNKYGKGFTGYTFVDI